MSMGILAIVACLRTLPQAGEPDLGRGAILPDSAAQRLFGAAVGCSRLDPLMGRWTPTQQEIAQLEGALPTLLGKALERVVRRTPDERLPAVEAYYRQYAGFIDRAGRRMIYVYGVDEMIAATLESSYKTAAIAQGPEGRRAMAPENYRRNHFLGIGDGGVQVFHVHYDVRTGAFEQFEFGGRTSGPVYMREPLSEARQLPNVRCS